MAASDDFSGRDYSGGRDPGVSRREFLGSAALTTAGAVTGLSVYLLKRTAPNLDEYAKDENRVRLGYIGVGNRGLALMRSSLQVPGNIPLAVCDARLSQREAAVKAIREVKGDDYKVDDTDDYRRILDRKDIEGVFIATPHFLHGPMAIDALEAGKHVYCEKALAYTIGENRDLYLLAKSRAEKQVFQVGHQRHYSPLYREVMSRIQRGDIGEVAGIRAQWNKNDVLRRPSPDPALEKMINWRLYSEYSGGLTTEFASHQIDVANWAFGTHPDSVCGYGGVDWFKDGRDTTDNIHLIYNYKVPIPAVNAEGWPIFDASKKPVYKQADGKTLYRNVRFSYMSIMQNEHLGPSELILGEYGTLEVSLLGGESFAETKTRGTVKDDAPKATVRAGSSVQLTEGGLPRRYGKVIEAKVDLAEEWVHFTQPIAGAYDKEETLLAVHGFLECIRKARKGLPFEADLRADVEVGLWGSVPALMANIAMREERTVYWKEFFPEEIA